MTDADLGSTLDIEQTVSQTAKIDRDRLVYCEPEVEHAGDCTWMDRLVWMNVGAMFRLDCDDAMVSFCPGCGVDLRYEKETV